MCHNGYMVKTQTIFPKLPKTIRVRIKRGTSGSFIAELVDYDVLTEFNKLQEADIYINDLIFTLFDLSKELQNKIWYRPSIKQIEEPKTYQFNVFASPEAFNSFFS